MSERKWHAVNSSSTFKPGFSRFERGEAVIMVASLGVGMILFRLLTGGFGCPVGLGFILASLLPAGVAAFLLCLVTGKSRHHAADAVSWAWICLSLWLANHGMPIKCKPLIEIEEHERTLP